MRLVFIRLGNSLYVCTCTIIHKQEELVGAGLLLVKPAFLVLFLYLISLIHGSEKHQNECRILYIHTPKDRFCPSGNLQLVIYGQEAEEQKLHPAPLRGLNIGKGFLNCGSVLKLHCSSLMSCLIF